MQGRHGLLQLGPHYQGVRGADLGRAAVPPPGTDVCPAGAPLGAGHRGQRGTHSPAPAVFCDLCLSVAVDVAAAPFALACALVACAPVFPVLSLSQDHVPDGETLPRRPARQLYPSRALLASVLSLSLSLSSATQLTCYFLLFADRNIGQPILFPSSVERRKQPMWSFVVRRSI